MTVVCKSATELEKMHRAGLVVWTVLDELRRMVRPGLTTMDLERYAARRVGELGAEPAFKGYRGYPCVLCTSVNDEVVHGIPSEKRRLAEGDIVSIDFGARVEGYYADAAVTVPVGRIAPELARLLRVTREALERAIAQARPGRRLGDISHAVESWVQGHRFSVVRELVGHGIGTEMHESPQVPNFGPPDRGPVLEEGMTLAIEPMVTAGGAAVRTLPDRWTVVTADGSYAAHFEHTVAVTADGPWILTRPRALAGACW